jgi:hypothetical protein
MGLPAPIMGLPAPIMSLPGPIMGLPAPIMGLPAPIMGLPAPIMGLPPPGLASAESAKTAAARISAAHIDTLFNIENPPDDWNFVWSFNANEAALVPGVTVKKKRSRPAAYVKLHRRAASHCFIRRHVVA